MIARIDERRLHAGPLAEAALKEEAGASTWRGKPCWCIYGDADKNIPAEALGWMAKRAGSRETVMVQSASHVVMVSHPEDVARPIEQLSNRRTASGHPFAWKMERSTVNS